MTITTLDDAQVELAAARSDAEADNPEPEEIEISHVDLVSSVLWQCTDEVALELCRTELGYVPLEWEARLGRKDWLNS